MAKNYYIASCIFTSKYPKLSEVIQNYVQEHFNYEIVRCCVPKYKIEFFENKMPDDYQNTWASMPDSGNFTKGDTVYSLCHNCSAIIEETKPGVKLKSLWELILSDETFNYPNYGNMSMTVQDCWRSKERREEQEAVRQLLKKMNINIIELEENYDKTDFCGDSLYRPAPVRNIKLAPKRFVDNAEGKFRDCTKEEQIEIMKDYCKQFQTDRVVAYCHYCIDGLQLGGMDARHIASLLFEPERNGGRI
ncbi:MAG: hypothetical protein EOM34_03510 [Clostridia bacterium]|nr:hypothetical protein [Lachnospiraceae bacterium]NCB99732.1 hypothetical protein [Clostridia bacterium]NCD01696.1 hypothetical protein [Clostridia bacterium]